MQDSILLNFAPVYLEELLDSADHNMQSAKEEFILAEVQLGVIEARYADMIWEHEPVTSSELVKMTAVEFNWKRTTAHNVLRRLIEKGLFKNENGVVTSVILT